jgi:hypothetical protein
MNDTGAVDQSIDTPEMADCQRHGGLRRRFVGNVGFGKADRIAQIRCQSGAGGAIHVGGQYPGATLGEKADGRRTKSRRAPSDNKDGILDLHMSPESEKGLPCKP